MHKRFVATTVLGVALLFSQGATVLVAALCPQLRSPAASCFTEMPAPEVSHEHMDHMQMDPSEGEAAAEENADTNALGQPLKQCPHCAMHSRSNSNPVSLRETEVAKRAGDLKSPLAVEPLVFELTSFVPMLASRVHGPPGEHTPRHILLNVFRI